MSREHPISFVIGWSLNQLAYIFTIKDFKSKKENEVIANKTWIREPPSKKTKPTQQHGFLLLSVT